MKCKCHGHEFKNAKSISNHKRALVDHCSAEDCKEPNHAKGYCGLHYQAFKRTGKPELTKRIDGRMKHPLYYRYRAMLRRCYDQKHPRYHDWGGRGIRVCDQWRGIDGFWQYVKDMGLPPTRGHTIDRRDNEGDYTPENCHWATGTEQNANTREFRKNNKSGIRNIDWNKRLNKWRLQKVINGKKTSFGHYDTLEEAAKAKQELSWA
jgi:hypothetical protein